jgi:non-specific protein-tyrosine kinase
LSASTDEAFRRLRASLLFHRTAPLRTVMVTGAHDGAGATWVAANLARMLAQAGHSVAAVDCDLRNPALHERFGVASSPGMSDLLQAQGEPGLPLVKAADPDSAIQVLPAGAASPCPAELLASARLPAVLAALAGACERAVIDTASVAEVADALGLAAQVDGVLLVLQAGRSRQDAAQRARSALEQVGARILGVVMTGAR